MKSKRDSKQWEELSVTLDDTHQDLLVARLVPLGFRGFLQEDGELKCYVPRSEWNPKLRSSFAATLNSFRHEYADADCRWTSSSIKTENWNEKWEKSIGIVEATPHIIIKPSWKKLRKRDKGKIVLHIDPKMAFGTGHHETTRLCLVLLEEHLRPGAAVLDFGMGTGILAIAAIKLGARRAVGVDNDPLSVENAGENIRKNRVGDAITLKLGDATKLGSKRFDLILANVDLPTITHSLQELLKRMKTGSVIIVSGLLVDDLDPFMNLISGKGIVPVEIISENEWAAVCLAKVDAHSGD